MELLQILGDLYLDARCGHTRSVNGRTVISQKTYVDLASEAGRRSKAESPAGGGRGPEYGFERPSGLFPKVEK